LSFSVSLEGQFESFCLCVGRLFLCFLISFFNGFGIFSDFGFVERYGSVLYDNAVLRSRCELVCTARLNKLHNSAFFGPHLGSEVVVAKVYGKCPGEAPARDRGRAEIANFVKGHNSQNVLSFALNEASVSFYRMLFSC
jgi:hypothetical protein